MDSFDFVVLGGGVSGLGFAKRASENGKRTLVLEKEQALGGLSRSLHRDGFYLDFCGHRFHTKNEALLKEILTLPGFSMSKHIKKSRIYMFGKYLKYPFEIQNLLRAMPLKDAIVGSFTFAVNLVARRFRKAAPKVSYKDWFVDLYGEPLYEVMCRRYTSKFWHMDPAQISGDWADQRFRGENLKRLVKRVIKKVMTLDFSSYDLEDDSLAPDGGPFYYPQRGIQEMADALGRAARTNGADIKTGVTITAVNTAEKTVSYTVDGQSRVAKYGRLISTIPLHAYYALQDRKNPEVEQALAGLSYMNMIFVYVLLDTPRLSNDHWIYFPDPDVLFNRATEFSNWSPVMCPPGKTSVCFDISSIAGDPVWSQPDQQIIDRVIQDAIRVNYLPADVPHTSFVFRVTHAYPIYDLDYQRKLDTIVNFLQSTGSEFLLGRTGIFRYNNSDNSIEMGFALAEQILRGDADASAQGYRVKEVSY